MPLTPNLPPYSFRLPWFMFDLDNKQLITQRPIPGDITDTKDIIITETPIPGLNYNPVSVGGNGNDKIGFTLPVISRNNTLGNMLLVKQFENLRNQSNSFINPFSRGQFSANPKVLYNWGTGRVPLVWYVTKCEMTHKASMVNQIGNPQWTDINIELTLDEESPLYQMEELYRKVTSLAGTVINTFNNVEAEINGSRPW